MQQEQKYFALSWHIEKQRETSTDCTEHWFLAAVHSVIDYCGWGWWFAVTCLFGISILLDNYFAAACSVVQNTLPALLLDAGKKKLFKMLKHLRIFLQHNCTFTTDLFMIVCHSVNLKKVELGSSGGFAFVSSLLPFQQPQTCLYEMWNHCEIYFTSECLDRQTIHM